jgi:NADH:flavin oxidoreductases, Old Yellow Enzyme family
LRLRA